jgi:hypothetical protein
MTVHTQALENALHVALGAVYAAEDAGQIIGHDADVIRDGIRLAVDRLAVAVINGDASIFTDGAGHPATDDGSLGQPDADHPAPSVGYGGAS